MVRITVDGKEIHAQEIILPDKIIEIIVSIIDK